jgi:hypothetical protein
MSVLDTGMDLEQHKQLEVLPPPHCPADGVAEMRHDKVKDGLPNGYPKPDITVHKNSPEPTTGSTMDSARFGASEWTVPLPCKVTLSSHSSLLVDSAAKFVIYYRC